LQFNGIKKQLIVDKVVLGIDSFHLPVYYELFLKQKVDKNFTMASPAPKSKKISDFFEKKDREEEESKKVVEALVSGKSKRQAANAAKEKFKEIDENGRQSRTVDDSDEDPDFDHAKAMNEKRKKKNEDPDSSFEDRKRKKKKSTDHDSSTEDEKEKKKDVDKKETKEKKEPQKTRGRTPGRPTVFGRGRSKPLGTNVKCPFCDEGFNNTDIVQEHMMASHENEKRYTCKCCNRDDGSPLEFPFHNNVEEHMTKEHNNFWSNRDKFDPLDTKPVSLRVRQAVKFCVIPKENSTWREDLPKPKVPRNYSNCPRNGNDRKEKIHCPKPKCDQVFSNDDPRILVDHAMSEHHKKHRYHCSKCGPKMTFNNLMTFQNHMKEKHRVNPSYMDAATDIYLVCQRIEKDVIKLLGLTEDEVDSIESMGRGLEDQQPEEEEEEEDDMTKLDDKWEILVKDIHVYFRCMDCDDTVGGRSGVIKHLREKHAYDVLTEGLVPHK